MNPNAFVNRHVGIDETDSRKMLELIGNKSVDELIEQTIPSSILKSNNLNVDEALSEEDYLQSLKIIGSKNKSFQSFIGQGYYGTITPSVIKRNILCNPGWYLSLIHI